VREAKRHFQVGVVLFNDGKYKGALTEFEASYRLRPSPTVLYNIGLTQKSLHRYAEAIATLNRYLTESTHLPPERAAQVRTTIQEMKQLTGELRVSVVPDGATVSIEGRPVGKSPLAPLQLASGTYLVDAAAEGYRSLRREVVVPAGASTELKLTLVALPRTGLLEIIPTPASASVRLDGRLLEPGPVRRELVPGKYLVELDAPGYVPYRNEVTIVAGQSRSLSTIMERARRPFYKAWWFWGGVAAVVGGGVAGIVVGTRAPDRVTGTLQPGMTTIRAP
jgi:hypothetical protein